MKSNKVLHEQIESKSAKFQELYLKIDYCQNIDCNTCEVTFVDALAHQTVVISDVDRYNISLPVIDEISGGNPYNRHKLDE
jgi:hypothetical protein